MGVANVGGAWCFTLTDKRFVRFQIIEKKVGLIASITLDQSTRLALKKPE